MKHLLLRGAPALSALLLWCGATSGPTLLWAAPDPTNAAAGPLAYEEPRLLVGDILPMNGDAKKLLFRSRRTSERAGNTVKVTCEYTYPDGKLAARDRIVYEAGRLVSSETEEFQTGEKGVAAIKADPKDPSRRKIFFEYRVGQGADAKTSTDTEVLANDTLVDDMIPGFIASHWDTLSAGTPARFRYIALSRKETVGFKLVKESEQVWKGIPAVRIRMEPTSFIIARLVDPLYFVAEKQAPHRILEYIGRTTPMLADGAKWKDLDADTVFEWK